MPEEKLIPGAPFFVRARTGVTSMTFWVTGALAVLAGLYSLFFMPTFILRFMLVCLIGLAMEAGFILLSEGRLGLRSGGSVITAAILVMSIPVNVPYHALVMALAVAIFLAKLPAQGSRLRFNPAIVGRLFLMLAFSQYVVEWPLPGIELDAMTTATPLELYKAEGETLNLLRMLRARISGEWEGLYRIIPGSPGDLFIPVTILMGVLLYIKSAFDWRPGTSFVVSFGLASFLLGEDVLFSVLAGSIIFSAIFIAGDPATTPASRAGRYMFGFVAGVTNALIRRFTYYSEGIVFAFLLANLLSPSLDRLAFWGRAVLIRRTRQRFDRQHRA